MQQHNLGMWLCDVGHSVPSPRLRNDLFIDDGGADHVGSSMHVARLATNPEQNWHLLSHVHNSVMADITFMAYAACLHTQRYEIPPDSPSRHRSTAYADAADYHKYSLHVCLCVLESSL